MVFCNLLAIVALNMLAGFADGFNCVCLDEAQVEVWNGVQGICGMSPIDESTAATVLISAVDGSQYVNDTLYAAMNSYMWDTGSCLVCRAGSALAARNPDWSLGLNVLNRHISEQVEKMFIGKVGCALMMALSMLVAMNTGLVAIAVLCEYTTVATCLNLIFILYFCFKYLQKRKHAWKQKTRLQKRQSRLSQHCSTRKLRVILIFAMFGSSWAMDAGMANQIAELARAATMAATAATNVAEKVGVKSMSSGMESASKVLKNPDVFNGEDPTSFMSWKLTFETWMTYGDDRFGELLAKIERMTKAPIYSAYDPEQKSMANKFFAILSSYMRGRTSALVRSVASEEKDGFRLWYELCKEYLPSSKQRTLSLAQTLAQYPSFNSKSSMLEQILNFEQLVGQYESSSGNVYPGDLKAATILRCSPARVREYEGRINVF